MPDVRQVHNGSRQGLVSIVMYLPADQKFYSVEHRNSHIADERPGNNTLIASGYHLILTISA